MSTKYVEGVNISEIDYTRLMQIIGNVRNNIKTMGNYCGAKIKAINDVIIIETEFEKGIYQATSNDFKKIR